MAAPKNWGYTREQAIGDELVVAWADGDINKAVAKEIDERLLTHQGSRADFAAYARAIEMTVTPHEGRDRILEPRDGLLQRCLLLGGEDDLSRNIDMSDRGRFSLPIPPLGTMAAAGLTVVVVAIVAFWMLRSLG